MKRRTGERPVIKWPVMRYWRCRQLRKWVIIPPKERGSGLDGGACARGDRGDGQGVSENLSQKVGTLAQGTGLSCQYVNITVIGIYLANIGVVGWVKRSATDHPPGTESLTPFT